MNDDSTLGDALLREDGLQSPDRLKKEWAEIESILKRVQSRTAWIRKLAVGSLCGGVVLLSVSISVSMTMFQNYGPPKPRRTSESGEAIFGLSPGNTKPSLLAELFTEGFPILSLWMIAGGIGLLIGWWFFSRSIDIKTINARLAGLELALRDPGLHKDTMATPLPPDSTMK